MVFEPDQVKFLVDKYGAEHVLLGTDYPYDMGEDDPLGLIGRVAGLTQDQIDLISGGRLILGVGAGEDLPDFESFGESHERATRSGRMDEGLSIIDAEVKAILSLPGSRVTSSQYSRLVGGAQ